MRERKGTRTGGWLASALAALVALPCAAGQPTRATINLDGSFGDWQTVFANPENLVLDGDGSTVPCPESTDRDCIVSSKGADIRRMAITWDDQNLYLYAERLDISNNKVFLLYLDYLQHHNQLHNLVSANHLLHNLDLVNHQDQVLPRLEPLP